MAESEQAIESARNLLLELQLEKLTGVLSPSDEVLELMADLDNAIYAWDSAQPEKDESRWRMCVPNHTNKEESRG